MSEVHPDREQLELFMLGELSTEDTRAVLQHLLSDCEQCHATTRAMWDLGADPEADALSAGPGSWWEASSRFDYDRALDRVFDNVRRVNSTLQFERTEAQQLLADLIHHPFEPQRQLAPISS